MYRFLDLTTEQKLQRRENLDFYGLVAQVSILLPLFWLQAYFLVAWAQAKLFSYTGDELSSTPGSPYAKAVRRERGLTSTGLAIRWRRFTWWCGDSLVVRDVRLGTNGQVAAAALWTIWLLILCFVDTGKDYLHLTKRFGIVAASQMPLHYLLSMKSPYSPLQFLTRQSHESLLAAHQLLGRIISFLLYCHAVLYINFYVQSGLLLEKLTQAYVLCGVLGIVAFTVVGTTALKPVRDWNYRVFYVAHVTLATLLLPLLYFHVHHIRIYIWETLVVYAGNVLLRTLTTTTRTGTIRAWPESDLVEITISLTERHLTLSLVGWQPGQHAYLSLAGHPLLRTFRSNPFTVASIPATDKHVRFVARILDGNTAKLAQSPNVPQRLSLEGPYGLRTHADTLLLYDRVLFVAGGIGGTFIVPLYRQLLSDLSPGKGSHRRSKVSFLWISRSMADVSWALPTDVKEREGFVERLRVHVTRNAEGIPADTQGSFVVGDEEELAAGAENGIELEEQKQLLSEDGTGERNSGEVIAQAGRPDLTRSVEQMFAHSSSERIAVVVCGPHSLSQDLRQAVGRWVRRGREVWFWAEEFAT